MEYTDCKGLGGWLFGHKYRARHSDTSRKTPPASESRGGMFTSVTHEGKVPRDFERRIYHADVCERCGSVVNRQ